MNYRNADWLREQYLDNKWSTNDIARECNVSYPTIRRWMLKLNVPIRSCSEAKKLSWEKGAYNSEEYRQKISEANKGRKAWNKGKTRIYSKESLQRMSISQRKWIEENGNAFQGMKHSDETKMKIAKSVGSGPDHPTWKGGISFEPYCPKFNFDLKERIRNRDGRKCVLCGKSEIFMGERASTHHIDGDKMQGCDGKKWLLVSLCRSCNSKSDTPEKEFLIFSNTIGVFT